MQPKAQVHGVITIKDGKVTFLKDVPDLHNSFIGNGDLATVLKSLVDAGWKLRGDYELKIYRNPD